eukprot:COSAG02_NODE_10982_length_1819_cov_1.361628_3_plen_47_part_01
MYHMYCVHICLPLTYHRELFRQMVPDPYIFGTAGASGFHWCFVLDLV